LGVELLLGLVLELEEIGPGLLNFLVPVAITAGKAAMVPEIFVDVSSSLIAS
jgi:hypothetical protein